MIGQKLPEGSSTAAPWSPCLVQRQGDFSMIEEVFMFREKEMDKDKDKAVEEGPLSHPYSDTRWSLK